MLLFAVKFCSLVLTTLANANYGWVACTAVSLNFYCYACLVLFGRGRPFQDHVGNKFLAQLVDEHKAVYSTSENHDKTTISWLLVDKVKENNGRFLKRVEDDRSGDTWWEVVSHDIARAKVTKSFRADMGKKPPKSTGM